MFSTVLALCFLLKIPFVYHSAYIDSSIHFICNTDVITLFSFPALSARRPTCNVSASYATSCYSSCKYSIDFLL